jgi:uncharacterized protein YndB with AHSA1/START domain
MPAVSGSVEINREPGVVFDYLAEPTNRPQWQDAVRSVEVVRSSHEGVGTQVRESRRVGASVRTYTWEVTAFEPPRRYAFQGVQGPVRAFVVMTLSPAGDGRRTRVDMNLDFEGQGVGRLLAVLARMGARREIPKNVQQLRQNLERL